MTVKLFKVGDVWHYRFQVGLVRTQKTTRERGKGSKPRAELIAQRAYADALLRANGGQPVPTLGELVTEWLKIHGPVSSPAHIRSVETCARLHFGDLADMPVGSITTTHIEMARNAHLVTHAPASANHWLRIVKLIANWAVKRDIIPVLPWRVRMLKLQKRPRSILPIAAVKDWFAALDGATTSAPTIGRAVRLMFGLGLRESEAAGARWEWIDWQRATYTPGVTKGREAEPVPIPSWLVEHLMPLRAAEGLISPKDGRGRPHGPGFARLAMRLANHTCSTKGITPHRLRGTFATMLSEEGVPVQTIQRVMRHKSALTTMAYLEKNMDTAALAQADIAEKIGFGRRENGEDLPGEPHEPSLS